MAHVCNPLCGDGAHCELVWFRPIGTTVMAPPGVSPYDKPLARSLLSTVFHVHGWRVRDFELAKEAGPSPYADHTEPWLVWLEPCPDCGPPTAEPFAGQ